MKEKNTQINLIKNAETLAVLHTHTHTCNSISKIWAVSCARPTKIIHKINNAIFAFINIVIKRQFMFLRI